MCYKLSQNSTVKQLFDYAYGFCGSVIRWGIAQMAPQCLGPQLEHSKARVDFTELESEII